MKNYTVSAWGDSAGYEGLDAVILAISKGARLLQSQVENAGLVDVLGSTGEVNVQGEMVQRLDSAGSDIFVKVLSESGRVAAIGCEELEDPVMVGQDHEHKYIVLMDPVDGSSNIDVAVSIGSIFGIWCRTDGGPVDESTLLRPGNEQIAAAYVIYGSSTVLVTATQESVQAFTLDTSTGEFSLTQSDIRIPNECQYYSTNDGNFKRLDQPTQSAVIALRDTYSLRYVGSLVADFHRNLLKGGVFLYPADQKNSEGKLRLMYEANPLGFVAEQAGGSASNGRERILDIQPKKLHQRTPLILGNKAVVEQIVDTIKNG
ncbi:class 1 fructose-bisphosphatase [SAR202 cluster bacterium AD-804-J14_MRT_500m]|nr:class 1 fructose-bisphosphatase [SAR202 cluster bacterium AD-804-J14_MRT_500m]